jgi:hypothetical protein
MFPNIKQGIMSKLSFSRRWSNLIALLCFSVFISLLCPGGAVEAAQYKLTIMNPGNGSGSFNMLINGSPAVPPGPYHLISGGSVQFDVDEASMVMFVSVAPDTGSVFNGYSNNNFPMPAADTTVQANFQKTNYNLTTSVSPVGGGTVTPSTTYVYDQGLAVVATSNAGWQFAGWTGDTGNLVDPSSASTSIKNPTTANTTIQANFQKTNYNLTTSVSPVGGGTVTPSTTYVYDQGLAVVATPSAGWQFVNWTGAGAGNLTSTTSASTTIINPTTSDTTVQANFQKTNYNLTTSVSPVGGGTVTPSTTYVYDQGLAVVATPNTGWMFTGWTGDTGNLVNPSSSSTSIKNPTTANTTIQANFKKLYTLTINWTGTGTGTVAGGAGTIQTGSPFVGGSSTATAGHSDTYTCEDGDIISLSGSASSGSIFKGFNSDKTGITPISVTMNANTTVTATFNQQYTLTILNPGSGSGTVDASKGSISGVGGGTGIALASGGSTSITYEANDVVTLSNAKADTTPAPGSVFKGFSSSPVTMTANTTVTATFNQQYTLTITWAGTGAGSVTAGNGSVSGDLGGTSSGPSASYTYEQGDSVTLSGSGAATPAPGSAFKGFSGAASGMNPSVTMNGNKAVTATFNRQYSLTITWAGTGAGSVTAGAGSVSGDLGGTSSGPSASYTYEQGDSVTLTGSGAATPAPGSAFKGFSGDASGMNPSITMSGNKAVTATFNQQYSLTITWAGTGAGSVTASAGSVSGNPGGTSSGPTASYTYEQGDSVSLNASAAGGCIFKGFNGDKTGITPISVTMNANQTVTAEFKKTFTLTINWTGGGTGTVAAGAGTIQTGSPFVAGSSTGTSGNTYTLTCEDGDIIRLSGTASSGSIFQGFNGDTLGATPLNVSMTANQTVTASFRMILTLTINWQGIGTGTVTASAQSVSPLSPFVPGASTGSAPNSSSYTCMEGDVIALTALDTYPTEGSIFKGWGGDASGTAYTVNVSMNLNKIVTANFDNTYILSLNKSGSGAGSGIATAGSGGSLFPGGAGPALFLYEAGSTIALTATDTWPSAGCKWNTWKVDYGNAGPGFNAANKSTNVTITGDLSVTGDFTGAYSITAVAQTGGKITPLGTVVKLQGDSQAYSITPNAGYQSKDTVVDGFSRGGMASYTFSSISANHTISVVFVSNAQYYSGSVTAGDDQMYTTQVPPLVLLVMGRNEKLYFPAYDDTSDLNGDGVLDIYYNPTIDYYGYFDSYKTYTYNSTLQRFEPVGYTANKKVPNPNPNQLWSGDFLNYLSMSRMDCLRKVLFGGYRSTDTATATVLERVYIPNDGHSWGKEYESVARDGYNISDYTPLALPYPNTRHIFVSTSLGDPTTGAPYLHQPLLRVLNDSYYNKWDWVDQERPMAMTTCDNTTGGLGPSCTRVGQAGGLHPADPNNAQDFQNLVNTYAVAANLLGSGPTTQINGTGNPYGNQVNYLTIFQGSLYVKNAGNYYLAVDGSSAVEVLVDGSVWAGKYGAHPVCNCTTNRSGSTYLSAGIHTVEFRQEIGSGTGSYYLYWRTPSSGNNYSIIPAATFQAGHTGNANYLLTGGLYGLTRTTYNLLTTYIPASSITDYQVRVLVGVASMPESNCKQYPNGTYKPVGILQNFGESGKLYFGLMTGSNTKNLSGGVLRKKIGTITDEIDPNTGMFTSLNGIISTINKLRIIGFNHATNQWYYDQNCGWITSGPLSEGQCRPWGNPIAEMMFEGMRYFAGTKSPTPDFTYTYSSTDTTLDDNALGLPEVNTWDDPFLTNSSCAKPFMLVISDINTSYDSNQLPGVNTNFSTGFTGKLSDSSSVFLNVESLANVIGTAEGITGNHYIGQSGASYDSSCSPKNMTSNGLGDVRGICPEEPTKQGSYYAAAVAYFGHTHKLNPVQGQQNVLTYVVALASPLPRIQIPVGGKTITLVPFAKSVGGCLGVTPTQGQYQPTDRIVHLYIESLTPTAGTFRITWDDVEQGADFDLDALVEYSYQVVDNNGNPVSDPAQGTHVVISLLSEYGSGCLIMHIGYIISGTAADGTYLEVRNVQTAANSDVDYFLDTPPGVTPPASQAQWKDGQPLPLSSERTFAPGTTPAATLLNDPLWYAAKWGGFTDMNGNNMPDLPSEWDALGNGNPDNYFLVENPLNLDQQLNNALTEILSKGVSYSAPVVTVDEANRTQSGDSIYMALFKPIQGGYWEGNLKKFGLAYIPRPDCGRSQPEWTVVDSTGAIAGQCDGTFQPTSQSFWSAAADGGNVDQGGAGAMLKAAMPGSDPTAVPSSGLYWDFRNIYTYKGAADGSMVRFIQANITNTDLGVVDNYTRYRIINFVYGYTYDAVSSTNPNPLQKRNWILGDIVHSQPVIIDYINPTTGALLARYIAVGANDGMLHVFTDAAATIGGVSYSAGDEIFAFVPEDLLTNLAQFGNPNAHVYTVDGPVNLHLSSTIVSGNYKQTLVFGEGRGGTSYCALDVTNPNPLNWKVKWQINGGAGGTTGFQDLAYTFSKPFFARMQVASTGAASDIKDVAVFTGGYDTLEDGFPEPFTDTNNDGIWENGEPFGATVGGTAGYDLWNPGIDNTGRGIYVVDLDTGALLFSTIYGDANQADDITTGTTQKYSNMKYCFPADVSLIAFSPDEILMYVADVYAQIWRIAYDYYKNDPSVPYSSNTSTRWTVTRIFASNPGSSLASGDYSGFGSASLISADAGRKAFYSPDVTYGGNQWTTNPVLYFGTGDREHPRYAMISNRIYFLSDTNSFADETSLLNLTCDELDVNADADHNGIVNVADATAQTAIKNLLYSGAASGFYKILDEEGSCSQSSGQSHVGEAILSQPTVFYKNVYFTSYQPTFTDRCNPAGNAYIYALDYSFGAAAFDYNVANDVGMSVVKNISDTYTMISGTSIPSGVSIITRNGSAAGLVTVGGGVVGIGQGGSTTIPAPPGGLSPILWKTD